MSVYWKQSLWIGGIYWLASLLFKAAGTLEMLMLDAAGSVILLLFLIPMNWLKPLKKVEEGMKKTPLLSTMLVSVGWIPYFTGATIVVSYIAALVLTLQPDLQEAGLFYILQLVILSEQVRSWVMIVTIFAAVISLVAFKKSVVGCLDNKFRLIDGDSCDMRTLNQAAMASAKEMYACKEAAEEKTEPKKTASKKKTVKKKTDKKATVKKKTVKKDEVKSAPKESVVKK